MMRSLTIAATCVAMFWLIGEAANVYAAEQDSVYPHVIVCELKGVRHFAYLDRVEADGRAIYMTPSGKTGIVAKGGVMEDERVNEAGQAYRRYWIEIGR